MKLFLLIVGSAVSTACFSQIKFDNKAAKPGNEFLKKNNQYVLPSAKYTKPSFVFPQAVLIDSTNIGAVYALPQDGMPCIVPEMDNFQSMPNAGINLITKKPVPHKQIPNPYPNYPLIPKKKADSK